MSKTRQREQVRPVRAALEDGFLDRVRTEFKALDRTLRELQQSPRSRLEDASDYVAFERQFRELERRRALFAELLSEAEEARRGAAWADLEARIELAWRELLAGIEQIAGPHGDEPRHDEE